MLTARNGLGKWRPALLVSGILSGALAGPAPADEWKYLPEKTTFLLSMNVPAVLKSKMYQELAKQAPKERRELEIAVGKALGIPLDNIARVTLGWAPSPEFDFGFGVPAFLVTTINPIRAEDIKARMTPRKWKEHKVGALVIHSEDKVGEIWTNPFCVAEERLVVYGLTDLLLEKLLERKKLPELSANMKAGLKLAGVTNMISLVNDSTYYGGPFPLNLAEFQYEKISIIAATVNEDKEGTLKTMATLVCVKDTAGVKKAADEKLADWTAAVLKELKNPTLPRSRKEGLMGSRRIFDAVKINAAGDKVIGTLDLAPAATIKTLLALAAPTLDLKATTVFPAELLAKQGEKATWEIMNGPIEKVVPTENKHVTATFNAHTLTLTVGAGAKAGDRVEFIIQSGGGKVTAKLIVTLQ